MPSVAHLACTIMGMNTEHSRVKAELPTSYIIHFFSIGVNEPFFLTFVFIYNLFSPASCARRNKIIRNLR